MRVLGAIFFIVALFALAVSGSLTLDQADFLQSCSKSAGESLAREKGVVGLLGMDEAVANCHRTFRLLVLGLGGAGALLMFLSGWLVRK